MGWWGSAESGIVGDGPLDTLGGAFREVVTEYKEAFRRAPTRAEWEQLIFLALRSDEEWGSSFASKRFVPGKVRIYKAKSEEK